MSRYSTKSRLISWTRQPIDVNSRWSHNWKSAQVVNSHVVCDPHNPSTGIWPSPATVISTEPFSYRIWSLRCPQKEMATYTDLHPCGETQTMCHIVESCPLTKLNGDLSRLHSEDKDAFLGWPIMVHDMYTRRRRNLITTGYEYFCFIFPRNNVFFKHL